MNALVRLAIARIVADVRRNRSEESAQAQQRLGSKGAAGKEPAQERTRESARDPRSGGSGRSGAIAISAAAWVAGGEAQLRR